MWHVLYTGAPSLPVWLPAAAVQTRGPGGCVRATESKLPVIEDPDDRLRTFPPRMKVSRRSSYLAGCVLPLPNGLRF